MRSHYKILDKDGLYFATSTIVDWIPIFTSDKYFQIVIDSLRFSQLNKGLKIYAYVILDNHFHLIFSNENITEIMKSLKSYTAKEIIKLLKEDKKYALLDKFRDLKLNHKKESEYQIWQESFHPELIISDEMLFRKFDYIHMNPVKRGLVENPEDWRYSSASFYRLDKKVDIILDILGN